MQNSPIIKVCRNKKNVNRATLLNDYRAAPVQVEVPVREQLLQQAPAQVEVPVQEQLLQQAPVLVEVPVREQLLQQAPVQVEAQSRNRTGNLSSQPKVRKCP